MSIFSKIKNFVKLYTTDPKVRFIFNSNLGLYNSVPDRKYLEREFELFKGKKLNLDDPQTFSEKLQWLKLYNRKPEYTTMVDKYEVKEYIAQRLGEKYVIPLLGVWNSFDEIDFSKLPDKFVLKCTHNTAGYVICKDKNTLNIPAAKKKLEERLKHNFYYTNREWPYKNCVPRIIAEEYMEDTETGELRDYKFFCFNGKPKCFTIDFDRTTGEHRANYYDITGKFMNCGKKTCPPDPTRDIKLPKRLDLMLEFAEKLSEGIPFVRVDFYEVDGEVYFGELTFFPASGMNDFTEEKWDYTFGSWLELPEKNGENL